MAETCVACHEPLVLTIDESDDDEDVQMGGSSSTAVAQPKQVPDDIGLSCGCHFHWQCLLDGYTITDCPNCSRSILSTAPDGSQQVLCTVNNEGGYQKNEDLLPLLSEEGYLKAYPEERKCRAFLEFCREGDIEGIVSMLQDDEDEDEDAMQEDKKIDVLRYQDTLGDMQSGLHAAVTGGSREVAWLLLFLASNLDLQVFPPEVHREAGALGLERENQEGKVDIRTLRDAAGKSAEQLAAETGGVWAEWIGNGRLSI